MGSRWPAFDVADAPTLREGAIPSLAFAAPLAWPFPPDGLAVRLSAAGVPSAALDKGGDAGLATGLAAVFAAVLPTGLAVTGARRGADMAGDFFSFCFDIREGSGEGQPAIKRATIPRTLPSVKNGDEA